jgi:hypothetical protein
METLKFINWKAVFVLSIILPVGLITTFRLTSLLREPLVAETFTLESVNWEFQRPSSDVGMVDDLKANFSNGEILAEMHLEVLHYVVLYPVHDVRDFLRMFISVDLMVNEPDGFVESIRITFKGDEQWSYLDWIDTSIRNFNLSVSEIHWANLFEDSQGARMSLAGLNYPRDCNFSTIAEWSFLPSRQTNQVGAMYELTYYNGTAYKTTIQPFNLTIHG